MPPRRTFFSILVLIPFLANACSSDTPDLAEMAAELTAPGPFGIGVRTVTFIDENRETPPHQGLPGEPSRTLGTEIWYPAASASSVPVRDALLDAESGPYPLIVFSHGFMASGKMYAEIAEHLAGHGYLVAAPDYPISSPASGGSFGLDLANHPADVSFLIDSLLELSGDEESWLSGGIDEESIGLSGHSLGGGITVMTTFGSLADPRVKAAAPLAPFACFLDEPYYAAGGAPILYIGGERDIFTRFSSNLLRPYSLSPAPKYLVEIAGGTHIGFLDFPDVTETSAFFQVFFTMEIDPALLNGFTELLEVTGGVFFYCSDLFTSTEELEAIPQLEFARQREITRILLAAFFGFTLKGEEKYRALFGEELPGILPEVQIWREEG